MPGRPARSLVFVRLICAAREGRPDGGCLVTSGCRNCDAVLPCHAAPTLGRKPPVQEHETRREAWNGMHWASMSWALEAVTFPEQQQRLWPQTVGGKASEEGPPWASQSGTLKTPERETGEIFLFSPPCLVPDRRGAAAKQSRRRQGGQRSDSTRFDLRRHPGTCPRDGAAQR